MPILAFQFGTILVLDDNFASNGEISVEPGSPETATVEHNVKLVIAACLQFAEGGNLEHGRVSVTSYNFVRAHCLSTTEGTGEECANCRSISRKVISFATFKIPLSSLFKFNKSISTELLFAVVDCMEMRRRSIETINNLL